MAYRVFVSYSTKDLRLVDIIKSLLERPGIEVFIAQYSITAGAQLMPEILSAIKRCDLFLLLWSPNAKQSEWVPQEIGVARGLDKPVIPIMLKKGVDAPGFLRDLKYLPLYSEPEQALKWLQKHAFCNAKAKSENDMLVALALTGGILWILSQSK